MFTRALHWFLSYARSIQSIPPHTISLRSISILSTHLHLVLPSGFIPSGFPTNVLHAFLLSPFVLHALPISASLTDHSNYVWAGVQVMKLLIMQFSPSPVTSSLFEPNILLRYYPSGNPDNNLESQSPCSHIFDL
jgi:hypothetical protein